MFSKWYCIGHKSPLLQGSLNFHNYKIFLLIQIIPKQCNMWEFFFLLIGVLTNFIITNSSVLDFLILFMSHFIQSKILHVMTCVNLLEWSLYVI
jgi:hypothetical protein